MVASVILAKLLGALYVIPLTRLIGTQGLGIYQNGYALYVILLTLATSGFPTAMGKMISERLASRHYAEVEQIFRVTLQTVAVLSLLFALVTWFGAPLYSYLVAVRNATQSAATLVWSVRALAPAVLIVPFLSALRGYMQGFQRMDWSGYSQTAEQLFRIAAMLIGAAVAVRWFLPGSVQSIAAGSAAATFGASIGALAGLVLLSFATVRLRRGLPSSSHRKTRLTDGRMRRQLLQVALPICAGALVVPLSNFADSVTVQNFLMIFNHESLTQAQSEFGILSRQAFTLIQLPLAFSLGIGSSILPALSQAATLRKQKDIQRTITNSFRSMFFITFPMAAAFFALARPLDISLFGSVQGAPIIQSVAFMGVFSGLEQISTFMLQGLGYLYRPVRNLFLGVLVKVVCNIILIPHYGIMGAAVATTIGYLFSSALNVLAVKKYGRVSFSTWKLLSPSLGAAIVTLMFMIGIRTGLEHSLRLQVGAKDIGSAVLVTALTLVISGALYLLFSVRFRVVTAAQLRPVPTIGPRLARLAEQIQRPTRQRPPR